jgi:hypothetical protein
VKGIPDTRLQSHSEAATDRLNQNCAPGPPYELVLASRRMTSLLTCEARFAFPVTAVCGAILTFLKRIDA